MKNKSFFAPALIVSFLTTLSFSCNSNKSDNKEAKVVQLMDTVYISSGSNAKGIGRFNNIVLTHPLDENMITKAQVIYNAKCFACHKLTDEKLVGPGWKGVTDRRKPEWIMNFITNTQVMLDKNLQAQSLLATCVVRMPSQDLNDDEAREMLEFMRKNDGKN